MNNKLAVVLLLVVFILAPQFVGIYYTDILTVFLINALLVCSYRLITTTGDWSLCHYVVMGLGAYATAIFTKSLGISFWISLPLSAIVAAIIGGVVVWPLLRTKGFGFFIATFAVGEFIVHSWRKFNWPFGGSRGISGIAPPELPEFPGIGYIDFYEVQPYYYLTLFVVAICIYMLYRVDRAPLVGDVMKALYMDEALAQSVGIKVQKYRAMAFITSSFFAGIAGVLLAHRTGAVDPKLFNLNEMVYLIIFVVVGGTRTFHGAFLGLIVMTLVFEISRPLEEWRPLLFGSILIFFLIFLPGGLESLADKWRGRKDHLDDDLEESEMALKEQVS
jgi:branched-chain amino acid transport system permease protein